MFDTRGATAMVDGAARRRLSEGNLLNIRVLIYLVVREQRRCVKGDEPRENVFFRLWRSTSYSCIESGRALCVTARSYLLCYML